MKARTVVAVEPGEGDCLVVKLAKAPTAIAGARVGRVFSCDPDEMPPWSAQAAVRVHGQTLLDRLQTAHPGVREALRELFDRTPPGEVRSLWFHVMTDEAERLCWETLCDPRGAFAALDPRWPIGRIADSEVDVDVAPAVFSPPLRIVAVLAALGIDAVPEWRRLAAAVQEARARGLAVEVTVLVGQEDLHAAIARDVEGGALQGVVVRPMPDRVHRVAEVMRDVRPHLVHFFCHGSVGHGVAQLELATLLDADAGRAAGSVVLRVQDLLGMPGMREVWLVTLNCCEGGKAADDLHSLAHQMVAAGVPASIGMLEPVDATDAHEFSACFYPAVFETVRAAFAGTAPGCVVTIDWSEALHPPRTALRDQHQGDPANHREWSLPVLYVRPESFRVICAFPAPAPAPVAPMATAVSPAPARVTRGRRVRPPEQPPPPPPPPPPVAPDPTSWQLARVRADLVAGALRALPADAPASVRADLLALLADVPEPLRPDEQGRFASE